MLLFEIMYSSDCEVKLDRPPEVSKVTVLNIAPRGSRRVFVASCKIVVGLSLRHFYVLYDALSSVIPKLPCIEFDLESEWTNNFDDFDGLSVVDLSHSFNFNESNIVAFLIRMAFVLVNGNSGLLFFADLENDERLCLFSIGV